jgi:alpha-L-fucosidase
MDVPSYLEDRADAYSDDPRAANRSWFDDARYGLFLHYGLYSLLGNHEWVQYNETIPPGEYAELAEYFTAEDFDAEAIVEFAQEAGMEYVNLTTKHHDGFCLFDSAETGFTAPNAPAGRDLVAELAAACDDAGLGFFCYYSYGVDWKHPHAPNNDEWGTPARPDYDDRPGTYADAGHDIERYVEYGIAQIEELLAMDAPVAGIWLDPHVVPNRDPERLQLQRVYDAVHEADPATLVSFKQGITGTEDFVTPEHEALESDQGKPGEVCTAMIPGEEYADDLGVSWGYKAAAEGKHKTADEVWEALRETRERGYNLLLNTAPLPEGGLDPSDAETLRMVGERIEDEGFPGEDSGR